MIVEYRAEFRNDKVITKLLPTDAVKRLHIILYSVEYSGPDIRKYLNETIGRKRLKGCRIIKNKYNDIRVTCKDVSTFLIVNEKLKELGDYYTRKEKLMEKLRMDRLYKHK